MIITGSGTVLTLIVSILNLRSNLTQYLNKQINNSMKYHINLLMFIVAGMLFSKQLLAQQSPSHHVDFSCFTYQQLSKGHSSNVFFSPLSIENVLMPIYIGARGETQKEIGNALQLPYKDDFSANMKPVISSLSSAKATLKTKIKKVTLNMTSDIWLDKSASLKPTFKSGLGNYNAKFTSLDIKNNAELARIHINKAVASQTNDKIKDLLKPGSVDGLAKMILTNAIYFQGDWDEQFDASLNEDRNFYLSSKEKKFAKFMHRKGYYKHMANDVMQILEIPYKGGEVSMVVILPKSKDGLASIESQLSAKNMSKWTSQTKPKEVSIFLPKFKLESTISLRKYLNQMGIELAFTEMADFSAMTAERIHLGKILQSTAVEVSEKGTEAIAATSATFIAKGINVETPIFMADRPFLFMIRDNRTGQIIFMGRYSNPSEKSVALNGDGLKVNDTVEKSGSKIIHIVSAGETLYQISRNYNVKADYIALSNKIEGNTIFRGQKILIDKMPESIIQPVKRDTPTAFSFVVNKDNSTIHNVQQGETLYSISKKYQISVADLKSINGLSENELAIGQLLKLEKSLRFLIHTVQQGDTLSYISKKYNKKLDELLNENKLTSSTIYIGQELKVGL